MDTPAEPDAVRVCLLGGFQVSVGPQVIDDAAWRLRKARALIKILALASGHRLHREQIFNHLWPDLPPEAAANNFHQTLHVARRAFGLARPDAAPGVFLPLRDEILCLDPPIPLWVDAEAFERAAAAALRTRDIHALEEAVHFYAGELLPDDRYEEWTLTRREALLRQYLVLLTELASRHEQAGEMNRAVGVLQQALNLEPAHEEAHVRLIRLHARLGEQHAALHQYERMREALREELGAEPSEMTEETLHEILSGRRPKKPRHVPAGDEASVAEIMPRRARRVGRVRRRPPARPGNLPAPLTSFIGREKELAALRHLLSDARLLTLTGPAGSGKSRLALELGASSADEFPEGVWWVDLAPLDDSRLLPQEIASTMGVREMAGRPLEALLIDRLRELRTLLVLDNCEHLLTACAALVERLLRGCHNLRIVATSRELLGTPGEMRWPVPPLRVPPAESALSIEEIREAEAVRLFIARSTAVNPAFELTPTNAHPVAEICWHLDGLPLAIELAAARTRHMSVEQILDRLADRFRFLSFPRTAPARHRSLSAALEWSYSLINPDERLLFDRLSVFAGSFSLEAAQAICADGGLRAEAILDLLQGLIDKSLVSIEETPRGSMRYRLLETMREYARNHLQESGEAASVRRRHRDWCRALAEQADPDLAAGRNEIVWLERLGLEYDNMRAALEWSQADEDGAEEGLRLAGALWRFWFMRGFFVEGRSWLEDFLKRIADRPTPARAKALNGAADMAFFQGDYENSAAFASEALALARSLGDAVDVFWALNRLSTVAEHHGDHDRAATLMEECVVLARDLAERHPWMMGTSFTGLGEVARASGDYASAASYYEQALAEFRASGERFGTALNLANLGFTLLDKGDYRRAASLLVEALAVAKELGDTRTVVTALGGLAGAFGRVGQLEAAARLFGSVDTQLQTLPLLAPPDLADYQRELAFARQALGEEAFTTAWAVGRTMTIEQAIQFALEHSQGPQDSS